MTCKNFIVVFILLAFACNQTHKTNSSLDDENKKSIDSEALAKTQPVQEDTVKLTKDFSESLDVVRKDFKEEPLILSIEQVNQDIERLHDAWHKMFRPTEAVKIDDTLERKMLLTQSVLKKYQKKMYPQYRKIFANAAGDIGWEHDMKVNITDDKNECIRFIGYDFILNKNKKILLDKVLETLKKYRYTTVVMTPYLGSEDGSLFEIDSPSDTADVY